MKYTKPFLYGSLGLSAVPGNPPLTCVMTLYVSPESGKAIKLSPSGGTPVPRLTEELMAIEL